MKITRLKYGNTNTFFINGLLFDTDMPGTLGSFFKAIKQNGIEMREIKAVVCSHFHPDHMGLVPELMKAGIKLIVLENQKDFIHSSDEILKRQFGEKFKPIKDSDAIELSFKGSRSFLNSLGIRGEIIPTFSHSQDGIALILDNGEGFAGDVEPYSNIKGYENNGLLEKDWSNFGKFNLSTVHFGHNIDYRPS